MKKKMFFFSILLIFFSLLVYGCRNKKVEEPESEMEETFSPSTVTLSEEALKIAKVKVEVLQFRSLPLKIESIGEVSFHQNRLSNISSRVAGRVEEVFAFLGDKAKSGKTLLFLYSPDFLSAQAEFIQAKERWERLMQESDEEEKIRAKSLYNSARNKLRLLNITEEEMSELAETHSLMPLLAIRAPFDGSIIECNIIPGDYVELGTCLFKIADLTTLWVSVNIYEKDLSKIKEGSEALVKVAAFPDEEFRGKLTLLSDVVDEKTRTVRGRVEVFNRGGKLKPGMYATLDLISPQIRKALFAPESAVHNLEDKKIVFVPTNNNSFSLRYIETGIKLNGFIEILKGLESGETIVTEGSFILKSELLKKSLEVE